MAYRQKEIAAIKKLSNQIENLSLKQRSQYFHFETDTLKKAIVEFLDMTPKISFKENDSKKVPQTASRIYT